jgi:type IV pilus assembly protein PilE
MDFAGFAERIYTQDNSYVAVTLPAATDYYTYSFPVAVTATSWTIRATPIGDQANDKCGTMNLTHTGLRTYSGTEAGCWGREVSS